MGLRSRVEESVGAAQYRLMVKSAARLFGFDEGALDVGGVRVPFLARGWGVPLLMVHGFGGDKESWLLMAGALPRSQAVVIVDLPGFGAAGPIPPAGASARAQAAVLAHLLDSLGYARAHLAGNSMGGGISLRFAHDYPERTSSLTLIGSVGPVVDKSFVLKALDRGENPLIMRDERDLGRLLSLVAEKVPPLTGAMRRHLAVDRFARAQALHALFGGWNEPRKGDGVPPDLESIQAPTLVIHGTLDRVIDVSTGRALAKRLPHARFEILEGIGHVPQMEDPRKVARLTKEHIAKVAAPAFSSASSSAKGHAG